MKNETGNLLPVFTVLINTANIGKLLKIII